MKIKRFKYWIDLMKYLDKEKDNFLLLMVSNSLFSLKYIITRFRKVSTPQDILFGTDSKEEVKIWVDLRGYRYKNLLIDDCGCIYCVELIDDEMDWVNEDN